MSDATREAHSIAVSVKCGVLNLHDAIAMAKECGCEKELLSALHIDEVDGDA